MSALLAALADLLVGFVLVAAVVLLIACLLDDRSTDSTDCEDQP